MLSGVQAWRKLHSRSGNRHRLQHELEYKNYLAKADDAHEIIPQQPAIPFLSSKAAAALTALSDSPSTARGKEGLRRVRFNPVIRVCLVPCRNDFRSDFYLLFWEKEDYQAFKEDALRELKAHWMEHKTSVKEAIFALYQPTPVVETNKPFTVMSHVDSVAVISQMIRDCGDQTTGLIIPAATPRSSSGVIDNDQTPGGQPSSDVHATESDDASRSRSVPAAGGSSTEPPPPSSSANSGYSAGLLGGPLQVPATQLGTEPRGSAGLMTLLATANTGEVTPPVEARTGASARPPRGPGEPSASIIIDAAVSTPMLVPLAGRERRPSSSDAAGCPTSTGSGVAVSPGASSTGGTGKEGAVRIVLKEDSPSSSVSSFEAPILIC